MRQTLDFTIDIAAPRARVWDCMLEHPGYEHWTAAFCEGSTFEGSWAQGQRIRFLTPSGDGMVAEIAENRPQAYVSIRHLGSVAQGVEDTTSDKVRAWAPAYENYAFADHGDGTRVTVAVDTLPDYEQFMRDTFPVALQRLKTYCERG